VQPFLDCEGNKYYTFWVCISSLSYPAGKKFSNIKFHENPFFGSRVVLCERIKGQTDGWTDLKKLIVALRNFVNAPQNLIRLRMADSISLFVTKKFCENLWGRLSLMYFYLYEENKKYTKNKQLYYLLSRLCTELPLVGLRVIIITFINYSLEHLHCFRV